MISLIHIGLENARSRRERHLWKTARASVGVQIVNYLIRIAVIPLSLSALGSEQYGLWIATGSIAALGGITDLGLSPGLINLIASSYGRCDKHAMRRYISAGFVAYSALALLVIVLAAALAMWHGLPALVGVARSPTMARNARHLLLITGISLAGSTVLRVLTSLCTGVQEGYLVSYAIAIGNITSLLILVVIQRLGCTLTQYAAAMAVPQLLTQLALGVILFCTKYSDLRPSLRFCDRRTLRTVWSYSTPLMMDQTAQATLNFVPNVLIASALGPTVVPNYSVPNALLSTINSTAYQVVSPQMPACAEASASGDWEWIRERVPRLLAIVIGAVLICDLGVVATGRSIITLWSQSAVAPELPFLASLTAAMFFKALSECTGVVLIGLGHIMKRAVLQLCSAMMFVVLIRVSIFRLGILAVPTAGFLVFLVCSVLSVYWLSILMKNRRSREICTA